MAGRRRGNGTEEENSVVVMMMMILLPSKCSVERITSCFCLWPRWSDGVGAGAGHLIGWWG